MTLQVQLVAPEEVLFEGEADMVVCRTTDGEIAFLTGHVPFLAALGQGEVRVLRSGGGEEAFSVDGGFVEVSDDHVTVLSDAAAVDGDEDGERAGAAGDEGSAER